MSKPNEERNKRMVLLRFADPKTYTVNKFENTEDISKQYAHQTLIRDWAKYLNEQQLKKMPHPFPKPKKPKSRVINKNRS